MSNLIQPIVDGKIPTSTATTTTSEKTETKGTTNLGHDAFLQLLVCEMQNQDPLEPTTNTEWISQLATFSQLEELQSLSKVTENSQMFSLIGKNVIVKTESASGGETLKSGVVDFISMSGGTAKFSVDGSLYSLDELYSVVDADYLYDKNKPTVPEKIEFTFNGDEPEDFSFKVTLGEEPAQATEVAVLVGNSILSSDYVTLSGNTVTIKKEILQELTAGTYQFSVVFNDTNLTTVDDMITVNIYNSHPTQPESELSEEGENTETEVDVDGDGN
ncbi:MAG: flagellar hook capping FlgD N-terminal domain-containing protein [Lachnospiraceae bacterium]